MKVIENEDGNGFTIEWDANDPVESLFNDWSQDDFIRALQQGLEQEIMKERNLNDHHNLSNFGLGGK